MEQFKALQDSVDQSRLAKHLEWFSEVRRDTGGPGEEAAANYIVDTLRADGIEAFAHRFQAFLSYPREASLTITADNTSFECVTHSFAKSTGPAGITGVIEHSDGQDFAGQEGKIVLIDGLCTPITVLNASKAGVAGIVFVNEGDYVHNMIATTVWGTPALDQLDRLPTVSAVSIASSSGNALKAAMSKGPTEVHLVANVETGWYESILPEVRIEGQGADSDDFILVGAHYCSWEYGLTDNATGDACLLEMARVLHKHRDTLQRSVRLAWWPGHSHGRYSGSTWYADTFFEDLANHCVVYHNVDSPGVKNATMYVARHTTSEVEDFCVNLINSMTGQANPPVHRPSRAADQSFLANGIPAFSTYPFLPEEHDDRKKWTGGSANAWWWHTKYDTLDKVDTEILALDTKISLTGVAQLSTSPTLPIKPTKTAAELQSMLADLANVTSTHVDLSNTLSKADRLVEVATAFEANLADYADANRRLMRFSRIMGNVMYAKGGRFEHDAADMSPIMRNTRSSVLPGLHSGFALNELEGSYDYGFALAGFIRQINRLNDAVDQAIALLTLK